MAPIAHFVSNTIFGKEKTIEVVPSKRKKDIVIEEIIVPSMVIVPSFPIYLPSTLKLPHS